MALNPETEWPGRVEDSNADYPFGGAKNETALDAFDGTPFDARFINDMWGFFQGLLSGAGITPNGNPETAQVSQYLQALQAFFGPETQTLEIGGQADPDQFMYFVKANGIVSIMALGNISHSSTDGLFLSTFIPEGFRPANRVEVINSFGPVVVQDFVATPNGNMSVNYRDPSGSAVNRTATIVSPLITYPVAPA